MNQLDTISALIAANKHNPRYSTAATLMIADAPTEITFSVTRHGSCVAFTQSGLSAIANDAIAAFKYLERYALQAEKAKLLKEIEIQKTQSAYIQARFSHALDDRQRRIEHQLAVNAGQYASDASMKAELSNMERNVCFVDAGKSVPFDLGKIDHVAAEGIN